MRCTVALTIVAACGGEPGDELDSAAPRDLMFTDMTDASPDLADAPYGGAAGWDHVDKYAPGVGLVDLDRDGNLDLIQLRSDRSDPGRRGVRVYRGLGDGAFLFAAEPPWNSDSNATCIAAFDKDADGDLDVFVGVDGGPSVLYDNRGSFELVDVAADSGVNADGERVFACAAGDTDGDGDLDLYLGMWNASAPQHGAGTADNLLLVNRGDGTFVDQTEQSATACYGRSTLGLALVDFDRDGDLDIFAANDFYDDCLFENRGDGVFDEIAAAAGVAGGASQGMGVAVGDLNQDGQFDLLVTDTQNADDSPGNAVYVGRGEMTFDSRGWELGLDGLRVLGLPWMVGWGAGLVDFDLDGDLDVHVATHDGLSELWWRNDEEAFTPQRQLIDGLDDVDARGTAYGDLDGDGDEDIVVARRGAPVQILRNDTVHNGGFAVSIGPAVAAPGTVIEAELRGRRIVRVVQAGSSYMSAGDSRIILPRGAQIIRCVGVGGEPQCQP